MSDVIYLSNARLSFPQLVEPRKSSDNPNAKAKYSADFILEPTHPSYKQFMETYQRIAAAKWGEHANNVMQMIHQDRKLRCYGSGAEKIDKKTFKPYSGYEGMVFVAANSDKQPQMIQGDGTAVDPVNTMAAMALARKLYGGCRVNAAIRPWLQDNTHGRGIRCELIAVQFAGDDQPFGEGAVDVSPMFGAVAAPAASGPTPAGASLPPFMQ